MKVIDPGHKYAIAHFDAGDDAIDRVLTYVKREGPYYPGNVGSYSGTNLQEVTRTLIDRLKYVNRQQACDENQVALYHYREALMALERRAARIHGREIKFTKTPELMEFCKKCGHIGCEGGCKRHA